MREGMPLFFSWKVDFVKHPNTHVRRHFNTFIGKVHKEEKLKEISFGSVGVNNFFYCILGECAKKILFSFNKWVGALFFFFWWASPLNTFSTFQTVQNSFQIS